MTMMRTGKIRTRPEAQFRDLPQTPGARIPIVIAPNISPPS